ncbi:transient receptor potential cation channel subfamily M member-like 2 isoform X3 [Octopus sinensis]|uniref:Transient receptor potential cation channel subfamily M member-like 2 isoform X3 n=1 Tax=Octopus sinensis TaxID=2607531 RepID=A0A7E6FF02_9MOLL|nr:transient receptor potential cation channel subfamily M member-like 2 isoform X3 [Octopus sinensis]
MDMKNIKVYPTREETIPTYNNVAFQENGNAKDSITKSGAFKNESNKTANAKTESTITGATNIESITVESSKIGNRDEGNNKDGSNEDESDKQGISKEEEERIWILENIKMRKCKTFVPKSDNVCHCGYDIEQHEKQTHHPFKWEEETDTELLPTNAFGEVEFRGFGQKIGKFVRVDHKTPMETIIKLITTQWNLSLPNLLISVTGGAKNFQMKPRLKEVFRRGLVKVARSTGAWVTSAGLHAGVMKHVGEAIRDYGFVLSGKDKVVAIGIAPWGCVQKKELLENTNGSWPAEYHVINDHSKRVSPLDPNHSHFILVDNGTQHTFGTEIEFRTQLEKTIASKNIRETEKVKIPAVVVMVEGGPGTLKTVFSSTSCHTPVIVVKGSGRAADIMAYAYQTAFKNVEEENDKDITDGSLPDELKDAIRKKIIQEFGNNSNINDLLKYVCGSLDHPNLVTVFEMDSKDSVRDIDMAILKALLKANDKKVENLRLTLEWNRSDIAKSEIFTDETLWPTGSLDNLMSFALHEDRVDFVKLFMEYGVTLKKFLTRDCLKELYNRIPKNSWLYSLFELATKKEKESLDLNDVAQLINFLMDDDYFEYSYETNSPEFNYPANELFLWSVLLNRQEMAFLFWKEGMEALPSALVANKLLKSLKLRSKDYDQKIKLQEHADLFEERAIGVLTECYSSDEKMALDLLVQERQNWSNATCMLIAVNADNKKFISHAACQSLLNNIWMGEMKDNNSSWMLILCTLCPLFIFLIKFDDNNMCTSSEETNKDNQVYYKRTKEPIPESASLLCHPSKHKPRNTCSKMFSRLLLFYNTPVITFFGNLIFYMIFLGIYSYVVLVELEQHISVLEWLLLVWVIGIFTEEVHQMLTKSSPSLWIKLVNYISDIWNIVDVITIILFIIGIILRHLHYSDTARVVLSLNLISFYFRVLHMFSIHQELGPKLVMIKKMMQDLGYFFMILFVFMVAYGIATQSILHPSTPMSYDLFRGVFKKAYFQMYGELFLEEYDETNCNNVSGKCPSTIGTYIAPILMCLYILLTNILLLNLLIAMFSCTFQNVQVNTDLHWHFQRYSLIFEFYTRPPLPPPLILLNNIYLLFRYLYKKKRHLPYKKKSGFREKFDKNDEKRLIHWEDEMADSYLSKKEKYDSNSMYEKVISSSNRIDQLTLKVEELQHQLQYSKYENSQNAFPKILSPKSVMEISKDVSTSNQKLQKIEEKMNDIDTSLTWIKEKLKGENHQAEISC